MFWSSRKKHTPEVVISDYATLIVGDVKVTDTRTASKKATLAPVVKTNEETEEQRAARHEKQLQHLLQNAWKKDTAEKYEARSWQPEFKIEKGDNGYTFLRYGKEDVILDLIESITVEQPGSAPCKAYYVGLYIGERVKPAEPGIVSVVMQSGRKQQFNISRWKVDILRAAFVAEWRKATGRSKVERDFRSLVVKASRIMSDICAHDNGVNALSDSSKHRMLEFATDTAALRLGEE